MRKTLFFIILLIGVFQFAEAQNLQILKNEKIPMETKGVMPILSPTSEFIILTGGDLTGLQMLNLQSGEVSTLSNDRSAGFGAKISNDGKVVTYRQAFYKDRLRYVNLIALDLQNNKEKLIVKNSRNLEGVSMVDGTVLAINNGKLIKKRLTGKKLTNKTMVPVASVKEGKLYVTTKKRAEIVNPAGNDKNYLWVSVSPDGHKLLYYVMETAHAYVSDIDGENAVSLGVLRAPTWLGNGWVVGMYDTDDGHVVTSSQLFAVSADGEQRITLTNSDIIAMNPSASVAGDKIVYNTADGDIYLMELEIIK